MSGRWTQSQKEERVRKILDDEQFLHFFEQKDSERADKDRFAELMIAALRKAGVSDEIRYEPEEFCLQIGSSGAEFHLGNAHTEYGRARRNKRQAVLGRYASVASTLNEPPFPDSFDAMRPNLLPQIRRRSFYDAEPGKDPPKICRVFSEHLAVGIVVDFPDRIVEPNDPFEKWGVTFDEELEIAAENLWKRSTERFLEIAPGFWQSPWRDNHDASRLFLTNLVRQIRVKGDPVCMVPNRDVLLVTGSEDVAGLSMMAALTEKSFEGGRAISAIPVTLDGDRWNPFMVSAEHPAFNSFRRLHTLSLGRAYRDQNSALDKWKKKNGIDVYIATFMIVPMKETNTLRSVSTWSEGISTLLPVADTVGFVRFDWSGKPKAETFEAPWERVIATVGHRMKPHETYPPRYFVETFPSDTELEELKG
jgi:hypothetical protein